MFYHVLVFLLICQIIFQLINNFQYLSESQVNAKWSLKMMMSFKEKEKETKPTQTLRKFPTQEVFVITGSVTLTLL